MNKKNPTLHQFGRPLEYVGPNFEKEKKKKNSGTLPLKQKTFTFICQNWYLILLTLTNHVTPQILGNTEFCLHE